MSSDLSLDEEPQVGKSSFVQCNAVGQDSMISSHSSPTKANKSRLPLGALTDPNSIYRKLYNRNVDFFLWCIEQESAPYTFKLHVQGLNKNDMKVPMVKRSVQALIPHQPSGGPSKKSSLPKIQVQFFSKKKQFKVFVEFSDTKSAKQFFVKTFAMKNLPILDDNFAELFTRDMRVYLVKTEEDFNRLALARY